MPDVNILLDSKLAGVQHSDEAYDLMQAFSLVQGMCVLICVCSVELLSLVSIHVMSGDIASFVLNLIECMLCTELQLIELGKQCDRDPRTRASSLAP